MYRITLYFDVMGRPRHVTPGIRKHRASGQAVIYWQGKTVYLGKYGSIQSIEKYREAVANIATGAKPITDKPVPITVAIVAKKYLADLPKQFPVGSGEPIAIGRAVASLVATAGESPAESFTPARLTELRNVWVQKGLSVSTVNKYHNYVLNLFRWAGMAEILPSSVWHALKTLPRLKLNRSSAKPPKKVGPVAWVDVEAIRPHVRPAVWSIVLMQWYTGMRSGEVLSMTLGQIVTDTYRPSRHKNQWRGHDRSIPLGPRAREIVAIASMGKGPDDRLFPGYKSDSYGRAIARACDRAGITRWHPHQIRHAVATDVYDRFGPVAAQSLLDHKSPVTTTIYAKVSKDQARKATDEIG
jgi:integrase